MSFNTYNWPSPWESTNNRKNPFDTEETTSQNNDTSSFDDKNKVFWQVQDTSVFDTKKINKSNKKFIYFNPEWLISTRKHKKFNNQSKKIVRKFLKNKYKIPEKTKVEKSKLLDEINQNKKIKTNQEKKIVEKKDIIIEKKLKVQKNKINLKEYKKELEVKNNILKKDKDHNKYVQDLEKQVLSEWVIKTKQWVKKEVLKLINLWNLSEKQSKFIKYEKNYEKFSLNKKIADTAIYYVEKWDNLNAKHCTDWVNKIYEKVAWERVYDSHTEFNGVKHIKKWTWIWVKEYASKQIISIIKPGDHIMLDLPVWWKYWEWKTHSVLALSIPNNWIVKVASFSWYWNDVKIEDYDLYWLDRAKDWKPIRIQTV